MESAELPGEYEYLSNDPHVVRDQPKADEQPDAVVSAEDVLALPEVKPLNGTALGPLHQQ